MTRRTNDPGRVLTLEQLRKAGACEDARRIFRETWGTQAIINQAWAREALAAGLDSADFWWAADHLLPPDWLIIFYDARWPYRGESDATWRRVSAAIFAALYVEAGRP